MELEHEFTVPVPVERAWEVLLDVEKIAPCMPGAVLDIGRRRFVHRPGQGQGRADHGRLRGQAAFLEKDPAAHRAVVEAKGRETRGSGTAAATVTASMADEGGSTRVKVVTDLAITGRPAQFGRGVMNDVGNKLIGQFADCVATTISASGADRADTRPSPAEIDLVSVAGGSVARRLAPVAAVVIGIVIGWVLVRRVRR